MTFIYHIAAAADWEQARRDGQYTMSTRGRTLAQEGFIHTSTAAQVALVANSFYRDAPDLVLLVIDPDRVTPEIRYEHVPGQDLPYPAHLRAAECRRGRGDPPVPGTTTTITAASKPRAGSCGGLRLPGTGRQPILASVASDFTDPVEWGLANSAGAVLGRAADMRADRRFRKSGRVQCGLRVIDGHQPGLAGRWRVGVASFSPRRLDFRRRWWRVLGECPPIEVFAVHGPPRAPSGNEILKLPGSVIQIQTPTAILECALHERYQSAVLARLEIPHWLLAEETAE